jgi:hypothetical protein
VSVLSTVSTLAIDTVMHVEFVVRAQHGQLTGSCRLVQINDLLRARVLCGHLSVVILSNQEYKYIYQRTL